MIYFAEAHTDEYLRSLSSSFEVAKITESAFKHQPIETGSHTYLMVYLNTVPIVAALPNFLVRWRVLNPFLYATSGSIAAARIAIQRGFAVNLGSFSVEPNSEQKQFV